MRFIILILSFVGGHLLFFFLFSTIGLLWHDSYKAVITSPAWFMTYTVFIGVWLGIFVARSYYIRNEEHFDELF